MTSYLGRLTRDLFYFPKFSLGFIQVWLRNFLIFKNTIWVSVFWIFLEPALYLYGIGYGLGYFVGEVDGVPYLEFYIPALMMSTGMFVAYFESTYGSYTKLASQNTYHTILLTPISAVDIALGEIFWGATKGTMSGVAVSLVAVTLGHVDFSHLPLLWFVLFFCSWIFSAFGVLMSSKATNYDWFIYSQSTLIVPMSLFCGTYFPLSQLPDFLEVGAYVLPLTHAVLSGRMIISGEYHSTLYLGFTVIFIYTVLLTNYAVASMERRIVV